MKGNSVAPWKVPSNFRKRIIGHIAPGHLGQVGHVRRVQLREIVEAQIQYLHFAHPLELSLLKRPQLIAVQIERFHFLQALWKMCFITFMAPRLHVSFFQLLPQICPPQALSAVRSLGAASPDCPRTVPLRRTLSPAARSYVHRC